MEQKKCATAAAVAEKKLLERLWLQDGRAAGSPTHIETSLRAQLTPGVFCIHLGASTFNEAFLPFLTIIRLSFSSASLKHLRSAVGRKG